MAPKPYLQSVLWLVAFGGLGYALLRLTAPSQEKLDKIKNFGAQVQLSEAEKKKILFMKKLKEAATTEPIYLKNKEKRED